MSPLIIDTIIEKVEASENRLAEQEKAISEITEKVSVMDDQSNSIKNVAELVKNLQNNMYNICWPVKEMTEMSNRLAINNELLANPRKTKKVIFHTAGRLLWIIIGLFLGMVFLIMGWVNTSSKLDQFRMHDVMWRYIKLTNQSQNLEYLQSVERLYLTDPEKMESMTGREEQHQNQVEESRQNDIKKEFENPFNAAADTLATSVKKRKLKIKSTTNR